LRPRVSLLCFPTRRSSDLFAFFLVFDAEVTADRFFAVQGVDAHQLRKLEEVGDAAGFLERLVRLFARAQHAHILPVRLSQLAHRSEDTRLNSSHEWISYAV